MEKTCETDILCGINKAKDAKEMTDLEKKHTPVIEAPDLAKAGESFEVTIEVGKLLKHPNEPTHFIEWIELYSEETFLTRVNLTAELTDPKVVIPIKLTHPHVMKARARCNIHGVWEGTKDLNEFDGFGSC
ncbi:MAG: class II SORL domain-containing protein [Halobacteriota archaeon]|nr:class II SORL domain-containing protein [Halobacteriota archaeon]